MALSTHKSCGKLAKLTACWFAVLCNILFTSLTNCARFAFTEKKRFIQIFGQLSFFLPLLLEFAATIRTFDYWKITSTFLFQVKVQISCEMILMANFYLAKLLSLTEFFKRMPGETFGAGVQLGLLSTHDVGQQLSCFQNSRFQFL